MHPVVNAVPGWVVENLRTAIPGKAGKETGKNTDDQIFFMIMASVVNKRNYCICREMVPS
jgi:hypothetical protein